MAAGHLDPEVIRRPGAVGIRTGSLSGAGSRHCDLADALSSSLRRRSMCQRELFRQAVGFTPPWKVQLVSFAPERGRLDLRLDSPQGAKFPCRGCERVECLAIRHHRYAVAPPRFLPARDHPGGPGAASGVSSLWSEEARAHLGSGEQRRHAAHGGLSARPPPIDAGQRGGPAGGRTVHSDLAGALRSVTEPRGQAGFCGVTSGGWTRPPPSGTTTTSAYS